MCATRHTWIDYKNGENHVIFDKEMTCINTNATPANGFFGYLKHPSNPPARTAEFVTLHTRGNHHEKQNR